MAREYSRVSSNFWTGKTGKSIRKLGRDAQVVALYLMTSPHANMLGLFHAPILYIAHETGMSFEDASKGLQSIIEADFCAYDFEAECVWVYEMAKFQVGEALLPKDKRVQGVMNEYERLPNNTHLKPFFDKYAAAFHMQHSRGIEAPSQPLRSQKQEQEQKQEQDQAQNNGGASRQLARKPEFQMVGFHDFWSHYPRKGKRPRAEEAWSVLAPDENLRVTILASLEAWKQSRQWSDKNFIPLPENWLKNRQFDDDVPRETTPVAKQDLAAKQWLEGPAPAIEQ